MTRSEQVDHRQRRRATRTQGPPVLDDRTELAPQSTPSDQPVPSAQPPHDPTPLDPEPVDLVKRDAQVRDAESAVDSSGGGRTPRKRRWRILTGAVAMLLVVALVAGVVLLALAKSSANRVDAQREGFLQTAKQGVLNLTTIHFATAPADVQHLLDGASGPFAADFGGRKDSYIQVVQKAQVNSDGTIISAGLEKVDGDTGVVLIASTARVSNTSTPNGEDRSYRLRVTVATTDGRMTVSNVEFVP